MATLNVTPAGVPDNAIDDPAHPLTLVAVTVESGFTVIFDGALVLVQPFPSV